MWSVKPRAEITRELLLIKVRAEGEMRQEMMRMVSIFRARVIDVTQQTFVIELTGDQGKLDAFIAALPEDSVLETVRSGICGISRGERMLRL